MIKRMARRTCKLAVFKLVLFSGAAICFGCPGALVPGENASEERSERVVGGASLSNPLHLSDRLRRQSPRAVDAAIVVDAEREVLPSVELKAYVLRDALHATAIIEAQGIRHMLELTTKKPSTLFELGGSVFRLIAFNRSGFELERVVDGAKLNLR